MTRRTFYLSIVKFNVVEFSQIKLILGIIYNSYKQLIPHQLLSISIYFFSKHKALCPGDFNVLRNVSAFPLSSQKASPYQTFTHF